MVLAMLREADMHPYEMMRLLRQRRADRLVPLAQGTLYHTVARLERAGLVEHVGVDREGNRPERTTYGVTEAGSAAVADWVRAELPRLDRPVETRVAIAEAHNLDRTKRSACCASVSTRSWPSAQRMPIHAPPSSLAAFPSSSSSSWGVARRC